MDLKRLKELLKIVAQSDVAEVEFDEDGTKVTIRKEAPTVTVQPAGGFYPPPGGYYPPPVQVPVAPTAPAAPAAAPPAPTAAPSAPQAEAPAAAAESASEKPAANETVVKAPIVGTFYTAPSPGADPYVSVGASVSQGNVLCIIEAMKLMNEIECEVSGTVKSILVEDGEPVEYDQPLFVIATS